jgi:hypothetical protein
MSDVKAGISDEALMAKYKISGKRFMLAKAAAKNILDRQKVEEPESLDTANAEQVLSDCRAGVPNSDLLVSYNLTERQLQRVFRKIISAGLASPLELSGRLSMTTSQVVEAFEQLGKVIREID